MRYSGHLFSLSFVALVSAGRLQAQSNRGGNGDVASDSTEDDSSLVLKERILEARARALGKKIRCQVCQHPITRK